MKYVIRRLIAGVVVVPVVAGTYLALYAFLVMAGADPGMSFTEVFNTGITIGITSAVFLTFYPQIVRFLDRVMG